MNARQWFVGLLAGAAGIAVLAGGCGDDVTNNNYSGLGGDSGIDVAATLSKIGCTAGKKDCVNDSVARVCPQDETAWIAVPCKAGEKCTDGDCKPVAGGPTAACVPGDGACLAGNKALRCKADGTGYEQSDCPAGTICTDKGLCKGTQVVGSTTCAADRRSVMTWADGFHQTPTPCAKDEYCVLLNTLPYNQSACKPSQCKPAGAGAVCGELAICGDPSNAANDQTKYVASCQETPDGFKWVGAACPAGQTCNPNPATSSCTNGRAQAACTGGTCTEGAQRCSTDGQGVQTCGADGKWGAATQCNYAAGERCFIIPGSATRAVCGDPICAFNGDGYCDEATGYLHKCDTNGKLTAPQQCATGHCIQVSSTGLPHPFEYAGRCQSECIPGQEGCYLNNGYGAYRVCDANSRWGAPIACSAPDGGAAFCSTYNDGTSGLAKHVCITGVDCAPNTRRCVNLDGGTGSEAIQICGADGKWQSAQTCSVGYCSAVTGGATCVVDCIPNTAVCDPAGSGQYYSCPANGKFPAAPVYDQACTAGTSCKRAGARSYGCIQCVGPTLTDNIFATVPESRCLADDGGPGNHLFQPCKADNTWDTPVACSSGTSNCTTTFVNTPAVDPGGVRYAYCL
jgi:hypothetical protein